MNKPSPELLALKCSRPNCDCGEGPCKAAEANEAKARVHPLEAGQPTNGELELAVCAVKCGAITLDQLKELRSRRTVWYGAKADAVRYAVDAYIRSKAATSK
jgi:hypothetical protein